MFTTIVCVFFLNNFIYTTEAGTNLSIQKYGFSQGRDLCKFPIAQLPSCNVPVTTGITVTFFIPQIFPTSPIKN